MIIPRFELSQTDASIFVRIKVPHVRVSPEQVQVVLTDDHTVLHFASPPYLLVLNFAAVNGRFHESAEEACAKFDPTIENGVIILELRKEKPNVTWENLDLLGRMAATKDARPGSGSRWLQSIDGNNKYIQMESACEHSALEGPGYGFFRLFHGVYADLQRDGLAKEMLELPWTEGNDNIDSLAIEKHSIGIREKRRATRRELETNKFCPDRYLGDLDIEDDYVYQCAMSMEPHWRSSVGSLSEQLSSLELNEKSETHFFTEDERTKLLSIPYPILPKDIPAHHESALLTGLLDLLFAYTYDHIITAGEPTVESAWTISILSASLSCLEDWLDDKASETALLSDVISSGLRRAVVYPYLRNFDFALYVWQQVLLLLQQGLRPVIRSLLQVRAILDRSELYYMGCKLFIDPYLAWLQSEPKTVTQLLQSSSKKMAKILDVGGERLKSGLELNLSDLEAHALRAQMEEEDACDECSSSSSASSSSSSSSSDNGAPDANEGSADSSASSSVSQQSTQKISPHIDAGIGRVSHSKDLLDHNFTVSNESVMPRLGDIEQVAKGGSRPLIQEIESTDS